MTPAELRRLSILVLAHARQLREEAELARVRSVRCRAQSEQAIASLHEKRRLLSAMLNRRPFQSRATGKGPS
jgi:hypothetical protein